MPHATIPVRPQPAWLTRLAFCLAIITAAASLTVLPATATGQAIVQPATQLLAPNATTTLIDPFTITGFDAQDTLLVSVNLDGENAARFTLPETDGLTAAYGFNLAGNLRGVTFTGTQADANTALTALTVVTDAIGSVTLKVTATVNEPGYFFNPSNGHFYRAVTGAINFDDARAAALASSYRGQPGYLATITSAAEQTFINTNIQDASNIWIDGTDVALEGLWRFTNGPEANEPFWRIDDCVTDTLVARADGCNPTTQYSVQLLQTGVPVNDAYTNWCTNEPNNASGEHHIVTNWSGGTCWNDYSGNNVGSIGGYVIEYGGLTNPDTQTGDFTGVVSAEQTYTIETLTVTTSPDAIGGTVNGFAQGTLTVGVHYWTLGNDDTPTNRVIRDDITPAELPLTFTLDDLSDLEPGTYYYQAYAIDTIDVDTSTYRAASNTETRTIAGPPASLALTVPPVASVPGGQLATTPVVTVRDANDVTVTDTPLAVTVTSDTPRATLTGTTTVTTVDGEASFADLAVLAPQGTTPTLTFTTDTLDAVTSEALTFRNVSLENASIRFGGECQAQTSCAPPTDGSFNPAGNVLQPFYYSQHAGRWYKLTYSNYPLNFALGFGTGGTNWSGTSAPTVDPTMSNRVIDASGFTLVNLSDPVATVARGYGTVTVTGDITVGGNAFELSHTYELGEDSQFVKITTQVTNRSATTRENVRIWVGTRDDYVGTNDRPTKTRGNLAQDEHGDSVFQPLASTTQAAQALQITTASEGVLFYSTTQGTNVSVSTCCNFNNAVNLNPENSVITVTHDGSYAMTLPFGTLAENDTSALTWYYAAGQLDQLADVVNNVGRAAGATVTAIGNGTVTFSWSPSGGASHYVVRLFDVTDTRTQVIETTVTGATSYSPTGLTNGNQYVLQVAAVTDGTRGEFSGDSPVAQPGVPRLITTPTTGTAALNTEMTIDDTLDNWDNGGLAFTTVTYQWYADGALIPGVTGTTFTPSAAYAGKTIHAVITRTNSEGFTATATTTQQTVPDTALANLAVTTTPASTVTLTPAFSVPQVFTYRTQVAANIMHVHVTATANNGAATLTVNGDTVASGDTSGAITLTTGTNIITIVVASGHASTTTTLIVTRTAPDAPAPVVINGPVTGTTPPRPADGTNAQIGTTPTPVTTRVIPPASAPDSQSGTVMQINAGSMHVTLDVTGSGRTETTGDGSVTMTVQRDSQTTLTVGGLRAGGEAQVWLPLNGTDARPVGMLTIGPDGTYNGPLSFTGSVDNKPLPIGTHVLQIVAETANGELGVINVPVTIQQPPAQPEANRLIGTIPTVRPGSLIATNAGIPETVTVTPRPTVRQTAIVGSNWTMAIDLATDTNGTLGTNNDGGVLIQLTRNGTAQVSGEGFLAGTIAYVWMFSTPVMLGEVVVAADGTFAGAVTVDRGLVDVGEHTLQIQGVAHDGYVRAANLGVEVRDTDTSKPPVSRPATPATTTRAPTVNSPSPALPTSPETATPAPPATPPAAAPQPQPNVTGPIAQPPDATNADGAPSLLLFTVAAALAFGFLWFVAWRRRRDDTTEPA